VRVEKPNGRDVRLSGIVDQTAQLRTRVAWLYYVEGLTQEQVAKKLKLTRLKVVRILAQCRDEGMVQIRINSKLAGCVELEQQLERAFELFQAIVVPTPDDLENIDAIIGNATGDYLSTNLSDGMTIGVGWGRTLQSSLRSIEMRPLKGVTVVSLLGGLTHATAVSPSEFAWRFADLLGAECYYIAAPAFTNDESTRVSLLEQNGLREVFDRATKLDMAVVSVGDMGETATIFDYELVGREDMLSLMAAGAVGDVLCHFLLQDGSLVDHPLNRRVMACDPTSLRNVAKVVLASGGVEKVPIMRATLAITKAKIVITEEATARALLAAAAETG
jgi:DNA-binding transcriptional regulator LsrR (DeoR family)